MASSAPMDRTRSSLLVLHTAVTCAPNALAICTANVPTPPAAPITSTPWPGCTSATSRSACSAVMPDTGVAAACSKVSRAGFATSLSARASASSAKEPSATPRTSSPGAMPCTERPTASTVPATSQPRMGSLGRRSPRPSRAKYGKPVMMCHTSGPQPAARTRTTTSCSPAAGGSMSRSSSTSAEPYRSWTIAFISPPWPLSLCRADLAASPSGQPRAHLTGCPIQARRGVRVPPVQSKGSRARESGDRARDAFGR